MQKGKPALINSIISDSIDYFKQNGYSVVLGPEVETEYYNFDALNIYKNHPAREMWDTFWIKNEKNMLLRTHTSPMQIRYMEEKIPPFKVIIPGKVFRNEATDSTHEAQFYQLEGLFIDTDVTVIDLMKTITGYIKFIFGENVELRFRPSHFPFTEPSLEVDMKLTGKKEWIEIIGCGMTHPKLLSRVGVSPKKYQGFAFGVGIDRIAKLKYELDDIRELYHGDLRFLSQF